MWKRFYCTQCEYPLNGILFTSAVFLHCESDSIDGIGIIIITPHNWYIRCNPIILPWALYIKSFNSVICLLYMYISSTPSKKNTKNKINEPPNLLLTIKLIDISSKFASMSIDCFYIMIRIILLCVEYYKKTINIINEKKNIAEINDLITLKYVTFVVPSIR